MGIRGACSLCLVIPVTLAGWRTALINVSVGSYLLYARVPRIRDGIGIAGFVVIRKNIRETKNKSSDQVMRLGFRRDESVYIDITRYFFMATTY